jgi:hypothetical protein
MRAGIKRLGLIHRGFHVYGDTEYRNAPMWHVAIEMKRRNPETMLLTDPSHICGRRDTLLEVAQKAIDLGFDGLMIESHAEPDNAWSDATQQVTPEHLKEMLEGIIWRKNDVNPEELHTALQNLRQQITHRRRTDSDAWPADEGRGADPSIQKSHQHHDLADGSLERTAGGRSSRRKDRPHQGVHHKVP